MALTLTNDILKFRESPSDPWEKLLIQANMNFNLIYPVGSIYMSTVNVDPGTIFGGTWEQLKDTFLLGAGDTYTAGDTGGEAEHTLIESEMPSHTHGIKANSSNSEANGYGLTQTGAFQNRVLVSRSSADMVSTSTGGNGAHNNMPPYLVVYMWRRLTLSPTIYTPPASVLIGDVASQDIVPVSMGGTGADNAADALANLGFATAALPETTFTGNDANNPQHGATRIYHFDSNTLNTAFKAGIASSSEGIILSSSQASSLWGFQLVFGYGEIGALYARNLSSGSWGPWGRIN